MQRESWSASFRKIFSASSAKSRKVELSVGRSDGQRQICWFVSKLVSHSKQVVRFWIITGKFQLRMSKVDRVLIEVLIFQVTSLEWDVLVEGPYVLWLSHLAVRAQLIILRLVAWKFLVVEVIIYAFVINNFIHAFSYVFV